MARLIKLARYQHEGVDEYFYDVVDLKGVLRCYMLNINQSCTTADQCAKHELVCPLNKSDQYTGLSDDSIEYIVSLDEIPPLHKFIIIQKIYSLESDFDTTYDIGIVGGKVMSDMDIEENTKETTVYIASRMPEENNFDEVPRQIYQVQSNRYRKNTVCYECLEDDGWHAHNCRTGKNK